MCKYVSCNLNRFHSFIFKFCIVIVHTLKMCTDEAVPKQSLVLFLNWITFLNKLCDAAVVHRMLERLLCNLYKYICLLLNDPTCVTFPIHANGLDIFLSYWLHVMFLLGRSDRKPQHLPFCFLFLSDYTGSSLVAILTSIL